MSSHLSTALAPISLNFDLYDHRLQDDPYPVYARLRQEQPLYHNAVHDFWVRSRHADVLQALRSDGAHSNAMGASLDKSARGRHAQTVMPFLAMAGVVASSRLFEYYREHVVLHRREPARMVDVDHAPCARFYSSNVRGFQHVPVQVEVR